MARARPAGGTATSLLCAGLVVVIAVASAAYAGCSRTAANGPAASPPGAGATSGRGAPQATDTPMAPPASSERADVQRGYASWYGASLAGHRTASGERFDPSKMTAAHRTLPFGTWVEVRRVDGVGGSVRVRITDRGPFGHSDRVIDLARVAAAKLGITKSGVALVEVRVVAGP
ncbi:MAG: septal ring lytic transglycosylase RlpA family protein [Polyangiaceae bacterium]